MLTRPAAAGSRGFQRSARRVDRVLSGPGGVLPDVIGRAADVVPRFPELSLRLVSSIPDVILQIVTNNVAELLHRFDLSMSIGVVSFAVPFAAAFAFA
jgi:hypothetical protein